MGGSGAILTVIRKLLTRSSSSDPDQGRIKHYYIELPTWVAWANADLSGYEDLLDSSADLTGNISDSNEWYHGTNRTWKINFDAKCSMQKSWKYYENHPECDVKMLCDFQSVAKYVCDSIWKVKAIFREHLPEEDREDELREIYANARALVRYQLNVKGSTFEPSGIEKYITAKSEKCWNLRYKDACNLRNVKRPNHPEEKDFKYSEPDDEEPESDDEDPPTKIPLGSMVQISDKHNNWYDGEVVEENFDGTYKVKLKRGGTRNHVRAKNIIVCTCGESWWWTDSYCPCHEGPLGSD